MKWKRILKENTAQPASGVYSDWKYILAEEGFHQCVYCALHDATFGERNFHVEHYKPKSHPKFKHLEHSIKNLFYACPICNIFKGDSWPRAPRKDHSVEAYPNPSKYDYCDLFDVEESNGEITGKFPASKYLVVRLHLNREQLVTERRIYHNDNRMNILFTYFESVNNKLIDAIKSGDETALAYFSRLQSLYKELCVLEKEYRRTPTYSSEQMR
jgi:5-methylcytosine-specific restriction endonuclease McrA